MKAKSGNGSTTHTGDMRLPRELTGGAFRAVVLLYLSGCLYASTVTTATGSAHLYSYYHLAFAAAVICLAGTKGFVDGLWRPLARNWSAVFLFAFLVYWLMMGLTHRNAEIGMDFVKGIFNQVIPGLLLGYVAFAVYGRATIVADTRGAVRWRPGTLRLIIDWLALIAYVSALSSAFVTLLPYIRDDLFLLSQSGSTVSIYQIFGNYIALAFISVIHLVEPYVRWRYPNSLVVSAGWALVLVAACWSSFLLAQMVGSNTSAALVVVVGGAVVGIAVYQDLRGRRFMRAVVILLIFLLSVVWVWHFISNIPPLRIFNFQQIDNDL